MPLKLQAHVDSRIWSLQSTVSFFFQLGLQRVYFFQNVRKMHIFPMFRNGVKLAQMSHPIKHDSLPRVPSCAHIRFAQNSFFVLPTKSSASMALIKKTKNQKKKPQKTTTTTTKTKQPPPPQKK